MEEEFELVRMLHGRFVLCKKCLEDFRKEKKEFEKKFMEVEGE